MDNKFFTLIMATYGRESEVDAFLQSIVKCNYNKEYIEIIIVDQNDTINLCDIVDKYNENLKIKHIKSKQRGLALNRNIGISYANGEILAFPDDDCEYLPNTLNEVSNVFSTTKCDLVLGRIIERNGNDSLRRWDKKESRVNERNFYKKCSSITMFLNREKCDYLFNSRLGAGQFFGACEDADLIYRNCKKGMIVKYTPEIKIYHPHYDSDNNMSISKIESYGLGFGAMVRANFDFYMLTLFVKAEGYHLIKMIIGALKLNKLKVNKSFVALISRIKGFIKY